MSLNEQSLVIACQNGDTDAFGSLYDEYIQKIYNFIYYKTHHKETAEDITSQTFFQALNHIDQCDPNQHFSSWLYRIARNAVTDHYRALQPSVAIEDVWDLADTSDVAHTVDTTQALESIAVFMKGLPSVQRDVLMLRFWQDMSFAEIAEIIGKSEDNCKVICSRALTQLRKTMPMLISLLLMIKTIL